MLTSLSSKPTLIYVGDPMCSWCYGIAPELEKVKAHYENDLEFELILGGLRPYNTQTMSELKDFLKEHWENVNAASGQQFSYDILDNSSITYDTEPPCRANVVVREIANDKSFDFFKLTQEAFYQDNKNMHHADAYDDALDKLEINKDRFKEFFKSQEMKALVKNDFSRASQLGVKGFPTLLLKIDGEYKLIANGYAKADDMITKINNLLQK